MTNGTQVVIHEANLVDYAGMYLARTQQPHAAVHAGPLGGRRGGARARRRSSPPGAPSSWRTAPEDLSPSLLTLKLNPPSRIADTRWITPDEVQRHLVGDAHQHADVGAGPHPRRHARQTTKQYLDFAAANGLGGTLVEGWNLGWDEDWFNTMQATFSFTQAVPGLRPAGSRRVRALEGADAHRPPRDGHQDRQLRAAAGLGHGAVRARGRRARSRRGTWATGRSTATRTSRSSWCATTAG